MKLSVYSLKNTLFEGEVERVTLSTKEGQITILKDHRPLITIAEKGNILYYSSSTDWREIPFSGGIVEVRPGSEIVILAREKEMQ